MSTPMRFREKMFETRHIFFSPSVDSATEDDARPETPRRKKASPPRSASIIQTRSQTKKGRPLDIPKPINVEKTPQVRRENTFGHIEGVPIGTIFATRQQCSRAGIHRPPVAGIHGNESGCFSIVVSGEYEDNSDRGDFLVYTGSGGRDLRGTSSKIKNLRTAPQSRNQTLVQGNLALYNSIKNRTVVRVVRGFKATKRFAPSFGYRYDGLYKVQNMKFVRGKAGFKVYKFDLERCKDQGPAPWEMEEKENE